MEKGNAVIIVGGLIEKDGKYLLVQEAKAKCRGKWNLPAGHLDVGESLQSGAKREIKEEAGCDVELTGVCQIGNRRRTDLAFTAIIFTARLTAGTAHILHPEEIMDVKWFTYEEIIAMRNEIRNTDLLIGAIENYRSKIIAPLEIVKLYQDGDAAYKKVTIKD